MSAPEHRNCVTLAQSRPIPLPVTERERGVLRSPHQLDWNYTKTDTYAGMVGPPPIEHAEFLFMDGTSCMHTGGPFSCFDVAKLKSQKTELAPPKLPRSMAGGCGWASISKDALGAFHTQTPIFLWFTVRLQQHSGAAWFVRPPCSGMHGARGPGAGLGSPGSAPLAVQPRASPFSIP